MDHTVPPVPRRHTTPTHLGTPDKILFGLTARQLLLLLLGGSLGYSLWLHLGALFPMRGPQWPLLVRLALSLPPALLCLLTAFLQIASRPLELWAVVWLRFALLPKTAVWRSLSDTTDLARTNGTRRRQAAPASGANRKRSRHAGVQQMLPVRDIEHNMVGLLPSGEDPEVRNPATSHAYVAVLEVQATNFQLKSPQEQHALIEGYRAFLLALRFPIQILVRASRMDLSSYEARLVAAASEEAGKHECLPDRSRLAQAHRGAIAHLQEQRTLLDRRCYVVIPSDEEVHLPWYASLPLVGKVITNKRTAQSRAQASRELDQRAAALIDQFSGMGLSASRLVGEQLVTVVEHILQGEVALRYPVAQTSFRSSATRATDTREEALTPEEIVAPVHPGEEHPNAPEEEATEALSRFQTQPTLLDRLAPSCLVIERDHVRVGDDYLRGIAIIGLPREIIDGALMPLLQLDEGMELTMHLHPKDSPALVRRLMREQAQYRSTERITQRRGGTQDPDLSVAQSDLEWLIPALASGEERLIEAGFYVMARARSVPELEARTHRILSTLHGCLLTAHKTTLEQWEAFEAVLPTGRDPLARTFTTTSTALAALFPFVSEVVTMPEGVLVGVTSSGEPVLLDPWGPGMNNPHEFWGGISGAGKSFAIKLRILHELLLHPHLQGVVIDPAGEYGRLAEALGGRTIRMAPGSAQSINPFDLVPPGLDMERYAKQQQGDRLAEKIHNLHSFLDILLADYTPAPTTLTSQEKSLLDKVLYECYRRVGITTDPRTHSRPVPLLADVAQVLRSGVAGEDTTNLAARLERFISGSLSGLFSRPTNVALDAPLVTFDLREMRGGSELKPAGIFLISDFLWTAALSHPKPRRCYIDEAWSLIQHQEGGLFLERMAREFRKHAVSLVTITQNPEQFIEDPRGSVIAQNAYTKVLKRLDTIGAQAARTAFGLSPAEEQRLKNLPQKQALLIVGSKRLLVETTANTEEYRLVHTDPPTTPASPPGTPRPEAVATVMPGRGGRTRKKPRTGTAASAHDPRPNESDDERSRQ